MKKFGLGLILIVLSWFFMDSGLPGQEKNKPVPGFFGLVPGETSRGQAELVLGEPVNQEASEKGFIRYRAPAQTDDAKYLEVSFFPDTNKIARIDVYLKRALSLTALRENFGGRPVLARKRGLGKSEEYFYPKYQGLILREEKNVAAIIFLSRRALAAIFSRRAAGELQANQADKAKASAEKAILMSPESIEGYIAMGRCFLKEKAAASARQQFEKAMEKASSSWQSAEAMCWIGQLYQTILNVPEKADEQFKAAVKIAPSFAEAHYQYGAWLARRNDMESARAEFQTACRLDPEHLDARWQLVNILSRKKENQAALEHMTKVVNRLENDPEQAPPQPLDQIYYQYGLLLTWDNRCGNENAIKAEGILQQALKLNKRNFLVYNQLGWIYTYLKDYQTAEAILNEGLKLNPTSKLLHLNLGRMFLENGKIEEAQAELERTLEIDDEDPAIFYELARCLAAQGEKKKCKKELINALESGLNVNRTDLPDDRFLLEIFTFEQITGLMTKYAPEEKQ